MKIIKAIILIVVLVEVSATVVKAQYYYDRSKNPDRPVQPRGKIRSESTGGDYSKFFSLSWDGNAPLSNPAYVNQFSATGFKFGFRKRLNDEDKLWVGGDFGESVYNQYVPYQAYAFGTGALATDLYHYAYNYNLTVNIDYFFFPMEKLFTPYVGLGIGASYIKFAEYYNIYSNSAASWGFLARPEVGFLVGFKQSSPWRLKAAAHFDYSSNAYNFNSNPNFIATSSYQGFINAGFQIGIVKMMR